MPGAQPVPLRPAAKAAPAQRPRRTRPRLVAIRVLRRRRPPVPPQTPPAPHRRLRPSLQSHKASPSPWRSHPSRVPLNHQPGDRPVSHGLNSDRCLPKEGSDSTLGTNKKRQLTELRTARLVGVRLGSASCLATHTTAGGKLNGGLQKE